MTGGTRESGIGNREINRREVIASMGVGAMAAYGVGTPSWERFKRLEQTPAAFFTPAETALLGVLVNIIIPRDAKSGSATDSGAVPYMDFVVGDGGERSKT